MTKKEKLIKKVSEYFDDPERGGRDLCNNYHDFKRAIIEMIESVFAKKKEQSPLAKRVGRSENYYKMSARDQWAEDKAKGILDWDGTEEWLDRHGM